MLTYKFQNLSKFHATSCHIVDVVARHFRVPCLKLRPYRQLQYVPNMNQIMNENNSRSDCSSHSAFCYCIDEPYHNYQECNADAPNPLPLHRCPSSHRPGRVQHGGLTTTSAQIVTNQTCRRETEGPTLANAPFMSADHIHGTVFLQRSATLTVTQRHICFIVLLLINFYFIFYTYVHYLLTIVMHSRPSLYDWALEHFLSYIIKP